MLPYLNDSLNSFSKKNHDAWLEKTRKVLFLSAQTIASSLNISRAAYSQLESSEKSGTITLESLVKAAEAMNCELVYAIRPKNKKPYSLQTWEKLLAQASKHSWLQNCDHKKRGQALAYIALETMKDTDFRKQQNWSNKANLL